ncbi:MAG TPA: selenide, water dikinase SelD, partial [Vicinamibacterales bacterium]|nr:selenide, water dikinase SelD [Vicinamibacterales bacterium]
DPRILVDYRTADDAGVYGLLGDAEGGLALVQTVDFFTPIVDDPYLYGQIAAANSLSDVYAMGGRPITALAIAGFPQDGLHLDDIAQIFRGGFDKLREAGVALLGGHTVQDREIKFGYSVTGTIDPKRILTNSNAKPGDRLILTKPLGTGIVGTAIKFGRAPDDLIDRAAAQMRVLNKTAAEIMVKLHGVHACTDITGFGLAGHASEMAAASHVTIEIDSMALPVIPGVLEIAATNRSGGMKTNEEHFGPAIEFLTGSGNLLANDARRDILFDPQTSGGLLISVAADSAETLLTNLKTAGIHAVFVGFVETGGSKRLKIR